MNESQLEFVWPAPADAIPILLAFVVLPVWLISTIFKYTRSSLLKKVLLVPVCLVAPLLLSAFWPLALKLSGIIQFTGSGDYQPPYSWYANELPGRYSDYVWVGLTTTVTWVFHAVLKSNSSPSQLKTRISCPRCGQALRVPIGRGQLRVKCVCGHAFLWPGIPSPARPHRYWPIRPKALAVVGILAMVLIALIAVVRSRWADLVPERWVSASYADLVNPSEITQSGESIADVRGRLAQDSSAYSQLQPFLEPYARLLPDALDIVRGPAAHPRRAVADAYGPPVARPAWVDLLRGGRYVVTYDGYDLATVFAPGRTAKVAYDDAFGVLRHPLGVLQASVGGPLRVEVFAYENDYAASALRLNTNPHTFTATAFGPQPGKKPIDLQALDTFFTAGYELAGARIDLDDGLVLVGRPGERSSLANHPTTVADLTVAYRAVFHAGHNDAFISLDPSPDPTRVRVNFGGVLEDTRLGTVVLQSDMRFKTLTSGLDPVTYSDLRESTRARVPRFMTVSERDLASQSTGTSGWEGTRFWFYPDSVEIQTDIEGRTAYVEKARFAADAERSRADFDTGDEFAASKRKRLSPSIRANIDDLNARYENYAEAFPELRELTVVARLMGISSWLKEAHAGDVDLDGLLAAELPTWSTPREKPQLLSVSVFSHTGRRAPSTDEVLARATVRRIDHLLDQPLGKVFSTTETLSAFLVATHNGGGSVAAQSAVPRPCRDYIRTREHLKSFAELVAGRTRGAAPAPLAGPARQLDASRAGLEQMKRELYDLERLMATSVATHNRYLDQHNALVEQYNAKHNQHNALAQWASGLNSGVQRVITMIEGGIDLAPKGFKVSRRAGSPELERMRSATPDRGVGGWTRSPRPSRRVASSASLPWRWNIATKGERAGAAAETGTDGAGNRFWATRGGSAGAWKERVVLSGGRAVERVYEPGAKELRVVDYAQGKPQTFLVVQREASGRIVFTRRDPSSLIAIVPDPPPWW